MILKKRCFLVIDARLKPLLSENMTMSSVVFAIPRFKTDKLCAHVAKKEFQLSSDKFTLVSEPGSQVISWVLSGDIKISALIFCLRTCFVTSALEESSCCFHILFSTDACSSLTEHSMVVSSVSWLSFCSSTSPFSLPSSTTQS